MGDCVNVLRTLPGSTQTVLGINPLFGLARMLKMIQLILCKIASEAVRQRLCRQLLMDLVSLLGSCYCRPDSVLDAFQR